MFSLVETFLSSFEKGGLLMWPILAVSVVAWTIGFDRLIRIARLSRARKMFLLRAAQGNDGRAAEKINEEIYDQLLGRLRTSRISAAYEFRRFLIVIAHDLDRGFGTMSAWINAAPLMGLLGTVLGMIQTFKAIMLFGIGNPHYMAEGISVALLTTQAGLLVAFPAMLFYNNLLNRKNKLLASIMKDGERLNAIFG